MRTFRENFVIGYAGKMIDDKYGVFSTQDYLSRRVFAS